MALGELVGTESQHLEFKQQLTEKLDFEKEIIAFLNLREGGVLYIGVNDNGEVIGLDNADQLQLKIKDRIKNNIQPSTMGLFDVLLEQHGDKQVIKIIVAGGSEKPYYLIKNGMTPKGCFIRIGSASEPMSNDMIESYFSKRVRNSIGNIQSRYQDLSFEQLKIYYNESSYALNEQFVKNLELVTQDGKLNYAAYLLSDHNGCSIKVGKYNGPDRVNLVENEEYGYCCLVKATKAVLDKLSLENRTFTQITAKERLERKMLHPVALREAVINAIVHNDFTREVPPKFELFSDRLEITSVGSIPAGLSQDEFFMGYSIPQNKELMRVFKDLDIVEQMGSGIHRILEAYPQSIYQFSPNFIRVVIPFAKGFIESQETLKQATPEANNYESAVLSYCMTPKNRE